MELSERCIAELEKEGYETVYEEQLMAGESLPTPESDTALFVTEGSLVVEGVETVVLLAGDRYRPQSGAISIHAGDQGCQLVIGEGRT
jgi:hypothetical protein